MNCEDVEQKIPLLCGGDLPPEENREPLMDHINRCASCRSTMTEYQESREVLQHLKDEGMPDPFWASFQQDLDAELADLPSPSRGSRPTDDRGEPMTGTSSSRRTALVAAAMLLVGIGLGYFGKPFLPEYGSETTTPSESVSPDAPTPAEPASEDVVPEEPQPINDRPEIRSVYNEQTQSELHDIHQEEPILTNPIHDLQPDERRAARSSD